MVSSTPYKSELAILCFVIECNATLNQKNDFNHLTIAYLINPIFDELLLPRELGQISSF